MAKIAFLFLAISSLVQERGWVDFFKGHEDQHSVYIHAKEEFDPASAFKKNELATKIPTTWENTMQAQIELLRVALQDPLNEKFIFVSDDSLPIQNFDYVYQQVMQHSLSIFNYSWNNHQDRDSTFYYAKRILGDIPSDKQFKNSQWIILNRKHAQMMVDDSSIISTIIKYPCDNEHYPSTFLAMHNVLHEVVNQPSMLTVWHRGYSNPFSFKNMDDRYQAELITEAIHQGILFARKIDKKCEFDLFQNLVKKYARKAEKE